MSERRWERAIVMGSGIAGLLAARMLSDYFQEVVVFERDRPLPSRGFRQGAPQERHIHTLLARGRTIFETFYPGFDRELATLGVPLFNWGKDTRILTTGGYLRQADLGIQARGHSRPTLEWLLRCRTGQIDNIVVRSGCQITGLMVEQQVVRGITFQDHHEEHLRADFVVDAMGRNSKTISWLKDLGYSPPPETLVNPFMGYATRWYRLPQGVQLDIPAVLIQPGAIPGLHRGAAGGMVEDRQVVITLLGMNGDYPPTDEAGFEAFARSLPDNTVERWLKNLEPISPIYGYRATNRLRHYERLTQYPERFIVIGDATCALNPIYGQGMSVAAMQAEMLHDALAQVASLDGFSRRFHRRLAQVNRIPWLLATSEDRRYPLTEGTPPNLLERLLHGYIALLFRAAAHDTAVARAALKTMHLVMHPAGLFHPRVVAGVLFSFRSNRKTTSPSS